MGTQKVVKDKKGRKGKKYWEAIDLLKAFPLARYYFILGGRACGKTYSILSKALDDAIHGKGMFAYVRRHSEYIKERNMQELFGPHDIEKLTDGQWNKVKYWRGFFYLERWEVNEETGLMERTAKNPEPIGMACAVNTWEGQKGQDIGAAHGGFKHIIYDEAITAQNYLIDEFQKFKNLVSSLVRDRVHQDTKIWLIANPLSKWCPFFAELGITKDMIKEPGHRFELHYPDTDMTTIFEYIGNYNTGFTITDPVFDTFFAFSNSRGKSKSITEGFWELEDSVHLPTQVKKNSDKLTECFMYFGETWLRCEFMRYKENECYYVVWSPSREPKKGEYYFILNAVPDPYAIIGVRTGHPYAELLNQFIKKGQIYYSDNTVADLFHGFIKEAQKIVR